MVIDKSDKVDFNMDQLKDFEFKFIEQEVKFNLYKIDYSYKTKRGNKKENFSYIISNDSDSAKFDFIQHINKLNNDKPYRAILNVKILDVALVGTVTK